ncbi:TPA: hypothetical protein ACXK9Z_002044 [Pseudomonas aeruginosa]
MIETFYEVSSLTDAVIRFGRPAEGDDLPDLLDSLLGLPSDALDDLVETLSGLWFDYSSHEHKYGEDPSFIERSSLERSLSHAWQLMEESLRYEARYLNPTAANLLEDVFGAILDDRTNQGHSVVVELGTGSDYDTLYRARVFQTLDSMEKAFEHPQRNFGPPPPRVRFSGTNERQGSASVLWSNEA